LNEEEPMSVLTSAHKETLRHKLEVLWPRCSEQQDWEGCLALLSDDFVYMPQDQPTLKGKGEVRAFLEGFPPIARMTQNVEVFTGTTDLAVMRGTFGLEMEAEGVRVSGVGKFLCTATEREGDWVFTASCFNFDSPPKEEGM
jgi:ketosteroid isomerase-like protein